MSKKLGLILMAIVALAAIPFALRFTSTTAQSAEERYFPESGHTVRGEFLYAYELASNPEKIYGYPITDAFENPVTGRVVQYFQRAHFELHPENPQALRVQLTLLGEILYEPGEILDIVPNPGACQYFSETNHQVCYSFLDFFNANGGIAQFGYPISEIEQYNDRIVQYFQRARFEWWPELASGHRIVLSDLGRIYFDLRNEDMTRLLANREIGIPQSILDLTIRSNFIKAVTPVSSDQTIYVVVQDQNLRPVQGARVVVTLRFPSGRVATNVMSPTNEHGFTNLTFTFEDTDLGVVEAAIEVQYDRFEVDTRSSFRLWY